MKIFITGGNGFLGSHLTKFLSRQHEIVIFDNFSNSANSKFSAGKNIQVISGDILDYPLLSHSMKDVDLVIHLAAQISVQHSVKNPQETLQVNVQGTQNILNSCLENNVPNLIAASTAAVFGNQPDVPLTEDSPKNPISPYGESKLKMEEKIIEFSRQHKINSIILRFFNLYGLGQSSQYAGVIAKFLESIRNNKELLIYGTGEQTRDFIHVDDAVRCFDLAIKNIDGKVGKVYNIGSGKGVSVLDIAKLLFQLSGKDLPIKHEPATKNDILHSQTSISLAKNELGFEPAISFADGISKLLKEMSL